MTTTRMRAAMLALAVSLAVAGACWGVPQATAYGAIGDGLYSYGSLHEDYACLTLQGKSVVISAETPAMFNYTTIGGEVISECVCAPQTIALTKTSEFSENYKAEWTSGGMTFALYLNVGTMNTFSVTVPNPTGATKRNYYNIDLGSKTYADFGGPCSCPADPIVWIVLIGGGVAAAVVAVTVVLVKRRRQGGGAAKSLKKFRKLGY